MGQYRLLLCSTCAGGNTQLPDQHGGQHSLPRSAQMWGIRNGLLSMGDPPALLSLQLPGFLPCWSPCPAHPDFKRLFVAWVAGTIEMAGGANVEAEVWS